VEVKGVNSEQFVVALLLLLLLMMMTVLQIQ
jgi:hypothetical protein